MPSKSEKDAETAAGEDRWVDLNWRRVWSFINVLTGYTRLFIALAGVALILTMVVFIRMPRTYTAMAVIGPPSPSPSGAMIGTLGRMTPGSLATSAFGSGGSAGREPFLDFQELLPSSRLSQVLMERHHLHQKLFGAQWDFQANRWKQPGPLRLAINSVKRALNIAYSQNPDVDTITLYLNNHLAIESSPKKTAVGPGGLLSKTSPYLNVYFTYSDPAEAENVLALILAATDQIVREDQRRDVSARIAFFRDELSRQNITADERGALISVFSSQEQLFAILQADHRYASNLIVPPHASVKPTSPPPLTKMFSIAIFGAFFIWVVLVYLSLRYLRVQKLISWSQRRAAVS